MHGIFDSARAKLTLWYLLLILLISSTLSALVYGRVSSILSREYDRLETQFQQQLPELAGPIRQRVIIARRESIADLVAIKRAIFLQLVMVNAGIVVVFSIGGYILSGITLRPIAEVHAKQRRFIGDAAHELKTPITALKTTLEVHLLDPKLSNQTKKMVKENLEDVGNLEKLTESLLKLANVTDQKLPLVPVPIGQIIDSAVKFLQATAKKKKITFAVTKNEATMVKGDQGALLDLLIILLDNAVKYSPAKSTITITQSTKGRMVLLTVSDQGIGIKKQDLPFIFDRFYRADHARTASKVKGYGLGLAVAAKIIDQHHGTIAVKSTENVGTTFSIFLPRA